MKLEINWQIVNEHLDGLGDLFIKGRKITFSIKFVYKEVTGDRTTRSASEELAVQSLLITLDEDSGGESEENGPDLERDMQLVLEGQEELLATLPSITHPSRSAVSSHPPIYQDCDRVWSEELRPVHGFAVNN